MRRQNIIRSAALAGTVGPIVFGGTLLALSVLEYDFMLGIGWLWLTREGGSFV